MKYRYIIFIALMMCAGVSRAQAYIPEVIDTPSQNEVMPLAEPARERAIYGNLEGYPHMFEFATKEPLTLALEILVPDTETARDNISGIVLFVNKNGSVREVARLRAREATWESMFDIWGGDTYRRGSSYRGDLEPGTYRIEISTPDNIGKYALVVGTHSPFSLDYFGRIAGAGEVKSFFGKSPIRIIESLWVYGPIVLITIGLMTFFFFRKRGSAGVQ